MAGASSRPSAHILHMGDEARSSGAHHRLSLSREGGGDEPQQAWRGPLSICFRSYRTIKSAGFLAFALQSEAGSRGLSHGDLGCRGRCHGISPAREARMSDPGAPKPIIYMPDTNVIAMIIDGHPIVIAEVRAAKAKGIRFLVPAQTIVEIKNDPDPIRRGAQLAFIRDFGMEIQPPAAGAGTAPANAVTGPIREAYFKQNPQLRGRNISDATITAYIKANPEFAKKIAKIQSPISRKDRLVLLDIQRQARIEGNGTSVECLTYEKFAGEGPNGNMGQKKRIALEFGIKIADQSRKLKRDGKVFIDPVQLWEIMPELRGKMISKKVIDADLALGRPAPIPPVPSAPKMQLRFRGTLGSGLRIAGMVLLDVIIAIFIQIILRKFVEQAQKLVLERDMKDLVHPRIIADLSQLSIRKQIFELLASDKEAFAVVKLKYFHFSAPALIPEASVDPMTHVDYEGLISISDQKIDPPQEVFFLGEQKNEFNPLELPQTGKRVTFTIKLVYTDEEIELYRIFKQIIEIARTNFEECTALAKEDPSEPLDSMRFWGKVLIEFQTGQLNALKEAGRPTLL
jgi:hypothetical protein